MSKVAKLAKVAALATIMMIGATPGAAVPDTATPLNSQQSVADAAAGDDFQWCDKGTQGTC